MPDTPLNVALVGYGLAGKVFHAPLITTTPGLRLAAVVSTRREEIAADLPGTKPVDSLGAALAGGGIDLVVVATPNDSHGPLAAEAIRAGCHVVVDKPFTVTWRRPRRCATTRGAGVLLSVFHNRRWTSDFLAVRRLIETGELGEIVHCEIHFDRFRPVARDRWREREGPGAGIWYDLGSHLIDEALQLFGAPEAIRRIGRQRDGEVYRPTGSTPCCAIRACGRSCIRARSPPSPGRCSPCTGRAAASSSTGSIRRRSRPSRA